ncbi:MAG TPA: hypothetical protein VMG99_03245 [Thermoplasmata archaeon]|jgi:hypothetical protein|nr:hypothetical protein [Thermoplasmata archaeon]
MQSGVGRDTATRRTRVPCKVCGTAIELARMRDHLRSEHQMGSAEVDSAFLSARIEARRTRRT